MKLARLATHPILALIIANTIWGAASPIFKWSLQDIQPFTLGFLRFFLAAILLLPFVYKHLSFQMKDAGKIFFIGFSMTLHIGLFFISLQLTNSINAPIIGSAAPVFLTLAGFFFLHESPTRKKLLGSGVGFLGVMVIVLVPALTLGVDKSLLGNLLMILATIASVWQTILVRELGKKYNLLTRVFWTFFIASIIFYPFCLIEISKTGFLTDISYQGIIGIVFGTVFSSGIAYILYYSALERLPVLDVGIFTYLDPVIAILIAVPLLHEIPTPEYVVGSFLVFLGIYIAERRIHYHPYHRLR